ncbi:MAG: prepilin-type N-terminal cleavage/methylation domain-containing protein [Nitrospinales bacterium]
MTSAGDATGYGRRGTHGFTLVEIILAIVIIGISVPAFVTAFSSMKAGKNPEFAVQASFLAQKYMENLTSASCAGIPATDGAYTLTCATVDVTALDPDNAGTPVFAKKLTLTIGRTDGEMSPMDFFTLF